MPQKPLTDDQIRERLEALARCGGSKARAGESLGICTQKIHHAVRVAKARGIPIPTRPDECTQPEGFTDTIRGDCRDLISVGHMQTADDVLDHAQIDRDEWEIVRQRVNAWGSPEKGMWQVRVDLRRRQDKEQRDFAQDMLAEFKKHKPAYKKITRNRSTKNRPKRMAEINASDVHFGKACYAVETGDEYNLDIACERFIDACLEMAEASGPVCKYLLPIGNDFLHSDTKHGTTKSGNILDMSGCWWDIRKRAMRALITVIDQLRLTAPVHIPMVPGNHDELSTWSIGDTLAAWYRNDPEVTVDDAPKHRKYVRFGSCLIGFVHGDCEKHNDLPLLMAKEAADDWAKASFHEWHIGHFHKKKEVRHTIGDTFQGVGVTVVPSLSGTDQWHYQQGYTGNHKQAMAFVWDYEHGLVSTHTYTAKG